MKPHMLSSLPEHTHLRLPEKLEEYHPLMQLLIDVGGEIRQMQGGDLRTRTKADGSLVTKGDEWAEHRLREFLHVRGEGMLGEEGTADEGDDLWIVDPIDGTNPYTNGDPEYGISAGKKSTGFLYFPAREILIAASAGKGAFINDAPLSVHASEKIPLTKAMLSVAFAQDRDLRQRYLDALHNVLISARTWDARGSTVDAFRRVVQGPADAMIIGGATVYDLGAIVPIARELRLPMACLNGNLENLPKHREDRLLFILTRSEDLLREIIASIGHGNV